MNGKCTWGDTLPSQCFGLGPERGLNGEVNPAVHLTTEECRQACCDSDECEMWQEQKDRGCYFSRKEGIWCTENKYPVLEGGRKCVHNYCGSPELELSILTAFEASQAKMALHTHKGTLRHEHDGRVSV